MAEFPALPLWVDAYMADCEHLSDAEHGVYLKVLMVMWRSPECRIPNDDAWLARRFRRDVHSVHETIRPILAEFCKTDGNWVWQSRLLKEHDHCKKKSAKNSETAKSRWEHEKQLCERNAPIPIPIPIPKERDRGAVAPRAQTGLKAFLSEDWTLPPEWTAAAAKSRQEAGLPALDWLAEAARFKAHWLHPDSKNRKKSDWRRTWLKWCMSAYAKPAEQSNRPSLRQGEGYAPPADPERSWDVRAKMYADMLTKGMTLPSSAGDHDVRRMVKEGIIPRDLAEKRGFNLWPA